MLHDVLLFLQSMENAFLAKSLVSTFLLISGYAIIMASASFPVVAHGIHSHVKGLSASPLHFLFLHQQWLRVTSRKASAYKVFLNA
jgi:hypothetical protein